jgi:periplasmic protein TonB
MAGSQRARRNTIAAAVTIGIQVLFLAALIAGTAVKYIPQFNDILNARLIKPEDQPPPKEPPPPPPDFTPPPITAPPPDVIQNIEAPPPPVVVKAAPPAHVETHAAPVISAATMEERDKRALADACQSHYPSASRRLNEEGAVVLVMNVAANGRTQDVKVETSSGIARLDEAAVKCMIDFGKFKPRLEDGKAVAGVFRIKWVWKLTS